MTLSCVVNADPQAIFHEWTMTGPYGNREFPQRESSLIIPKVTYRHTGHYVCSAYNSVDQKAAYTIVQLNCNYSLYLFSEYF